MIEVVIYNSLVYDCELLLFMYECIGIDKPYLSYKFLSPSGVLHGN
jgi:hypothetical protein